MTIRHARETALTSIRALKSLSQFARISVIVTTMTGCTALTEPRGFIPTGGEDGVVLDPRIGVTYTPVPEGFLKCATRYDGVSVCWLVADTVTVR